MLPEDYCKADPRNVGWGVGEELTKSWPTFEQLCVQNLALAISCCFSPTKSVYKIQLIDPLLGLFRGAVFRHGGGARKQPIEQPTDMPTSTMALMGRFPSLMGRFPTLMGRFPDFALMGRFPSRKSPGKQPIKKRGIKRFLILNW